MCKPSLLLLPSLSSLFMASHPGQGQPQVPVQLQVTLPVLGSCPVLPLLLEALLQVLLLLC